MHGATERGGLEKIARGGRRLARLAGRGKGCIWHATDKLYAPIREKLGRVRGSFRIGWPRGGGRCSKRTRTSSHRKIESPLITRHNKNNYRQVRKKRNEALPGSGGGAPCGALCPGLRQAHWYVRVRFVAVKLLSATARDGVRPCPTPSRSIGRAWGMHATARTANRISNLL